MIITHKYVRSNLKLKRKRKALKKNRIILLAVFITAALASAGIAFRDGGFLRYVNNGSEGNTEYYVGNGTNSYAAAYGEAIGRTYEYYGSAFQEVNGNVPFFEESELVGYSFERYAPLDGLERCGAAYACIGVDIMPVSEREPIGAVKPSGWHTVKYSGLIDGNYLYNRCHLIAFELAGENANEKNLITGTRYMNVEGMLPFENRVAAYVKRTCNHVLYRVTPVFEGENLVASGVLMEGRSVEDGGAGICFCVYVFNVQPGIAIDYGTGESERKRNDD